MPVPAVDSSKSLSILSSASWISTNTDLPLGAQGLSKLLTMSDADMRQLEEAVLEDLREDDLPLIHVWWHANSLYPSLPLSERLALAERAVSSLLSKRRAGLVSGTWPEGPTPDSELLGPEESEAVLREYATWVPERDGPMYYLEEAPPP